MKITVLAICLLVATLAVAQQQTPPGSTPPTFPSDTEHKGVPPDTTAPPQQPAPPDANTPPQAPLPPDRNAQPMSAGEIQQEMQKKLDTEPDLSSAHVKAEVNDTVVTLTGTVEGEQQHDLALRIAHSYAGDRTIDDKIQVKSGS